MRRDDRLMEKKIRWMDQKIHDRVNNDKEQAPARYLNATDFAALSIAFLVAVALGFLLGATTTAASDTPPGYIQDTHPATDSLNVTGTTFHIDDYRITLQNDSHPKMNGSTIGYAYPGGPKHLFIEKGLSAETTYDTCVHEHLHQLGIGGDTNQHYYVNMFEDRLVDPICLRFLARTNSTTPGPPEVYS